MRYIIVLSLFFGLLFAQKDENINAQVSHTTTVSSVPYDWKYEYDLYYPERPLIDNNEVMKRLFNPSYNNYPTYPTYSDDYANYGYGMAYAMGRHALNGLVNTYRASKDIKYLNEARDQINTMFSSTWFKDGTNGDGYKGWGLHVDDGETSISPPIVKD